MELIVETSVFDDERLSDDVQEVQQVASTAMNIAGNNSQYFWCTETGTDTGVHITLTPQDTFKANPSGYNLLARNNGVEVRDGLTACSVFTNGGTYFNAMLNGTNQLVAKYEASGAQIGADLTGYKNLLLDNTNGLLFRNGTVDLAHYNTGSVVFYDGNTTTNHELMNLGITGITLKNNSGHKTFYAGNNGLSVYDGASTEYELLGLSTTGLILKDDTGLQYASFGEESVIGTGYGRGKANTYISAGGLRIGSDSTSLVELSYSINPSNGYPAAGEINFPTYGSMGYYSTTGHAPAEPPFAYGLFYLDAFGTLAINNHVAIAGSSQTEVSGWGLPSTIPANTKMYVDGDIYVDGRVISSYSYITAATKSTDNNTIYGENDTSHDHYLTVSIDASQAGYTLIGVMSYNITNSSSGGQNASQCTVYGISFSGNTVSVKVRNRAASNAKVDVNVRCLYIAS